MVLNLLNFLLNLRHRSITIRYISFAFNYDFSLWYGFLYHFSSAWTMNKIRVIGRIRTRVRSNCKHERYQLYYGNCKFSQGKLINSMWRIKKRTVPSKSVNFFRNLDGYNSENIFLHFSGPFDQKICDFFKLEDWDQL